jgi:DMSO/TMAO reductase YedYZ molybdopterin-dependent catalytic subunit
MARKGPGDIGPCPRPGRRDLLRGALVWPLAYAGQGAIRGAAEDDSPARPDRRPSNLIGRQRNPDNLEFPFSTLDIDRFLTPNEQFYVRTHFEVPKLEAKTWRLAVEGEVSKPFEIGYDELRKLPARTVPALLECSGNGRGFLKPPQVGIRWELGAVGTAEWTGVPLAAIIERAGVKPGAVEVVLEGADKGEFQPPLPRTPGKIAYARSLPLSKARQEEVLLAYAMNGEELPPRHGHPVRAVVPGWYGMASVKWLERIIVTDRPFRGYFQTMNYAIWERQHGLPSLVPVTEVQVKAQVARPAPFEVVPKGTKYRMYGAAWAGESGVAKVEVSDDGGQTWRAATLVGKAIRYAWRFWEYDWTTPGSSGRHVVMARATDSRGSTQPAERDPDRRDAVISHILPIEIEVR